MAKKAVKKSTNKVKGYVSEKVKSTKEVQTKKKVKKETFEIGSFTERGALSLRKIYEKAGYKFVSHRVADNALIMQKFEDKE